MRHCFGWSLANCLPPLAPTLLAVVWLTGISMTSGLVLAQDSTAGRSISSFIERNCFECHMGSESEGGLDLQKIIATSISPEDLSSDLSVWIKIHDRVESGEMPPKSDLKKEEVLPFVGALFSQLVDADRQLLAKTGRSVWRRMNRYEYENSVRELLHAPWLQLKSILPEDGEQQRFNKIGEALDTSHVNLARYMQAADYALREVMATRQGPVAGGPVAVEAEVAEAEAIDDNSKRVRRYYARDQKSFSKKVQFSEFNRSPERATFPLIDYDADLEVLKDKSTFVSVGASDPEKRERESFGVVASSYEPIEVRFNEFKAPESGKYRLRFKGYTFWVEGEEKKWWRPVREKTSKGRRSEPVAIYSVSPPRQLRKLGEFDFEIEPTVKEIEVYLLKGESIQPDAVRLFRSRPPNWHNPLAGKDGMPGVAFSYMEVEGPELDSWPTRGQKLLFGDLPQIRSGGPKAPLAVQPSSNPIEDARGLLSNFLSVAYHRPVKTDEVNRFTTVVASALKADTPFEEAMLAGYTAILCSPEFLCIEEQVGELDDESIAVRLSLFLWNSLPDATLKQLAREGKLKDKATLLGQVDRLIADERANQFVEAFLAYWLDLRKINDTSPDERIYPDYYLDDSLVDAALTESQLFFQSLIRENRPAKNIVDSDFTFVNERLALHYQLPPVDGVAMRRVKLPPDSPRGGMLTQASILKVTANGTTTSPVVRGAWVNERILGIQNPPPPKSVPAIEPDTRGATTIRQQLELHRADTSCNGCHAIIDPVGFALENFDVAGGWRDRYRSLGDAGEAVEGFGKNGQPFTFRQGPPVDASGNLASGKKFASIYELKKILQSDARPIAKNLCQQLTVYATGTPMRFSDRVEVEQMLDRISSDGYPIRSMIGEIVTSNLFLHK